MKNDSESNPLHLAEIERLQFSCDLHDGLLQYLIGARLATESLRHQFTKMDSNDLRLRLVEIESILQKGISEGRRWIGDLRGERDAHEHTLESLLNKVVDEFRIAHKEPILYTDLDPGALKIEFPQSIRTAIFRIAQEGLRNAARHSKAKSITLSIAYGDEPHPWSLEIHDDGRGFVVDAEHEDHFGLVGMKTRAQLIGAEIDIESQPNRGSRIRLSI